MDLHPLSRTEKQNKRKQLIIDKAIELTVAHGLDQLSIADIAKASGLGPGQIYRCFQDKDEIIENMILSITDKRICTPGFHRHDVHIKAQELASGHPNNMSSEELSLLYEVLNISGNNKIIETIEKSEKKMQEQGLYILKEYYKTASPQEIRAIAEVVATLTEGVILRTAKGYSQDVDQAILQRIYETMLTAMDSLFGEVKEKENNIQ
ncbi:TetR/AcrR family transcriptional regulator [Acinetobacter sp. BSP-153]|jgi:AcrR family transcriptional regulator|uniref:TetR/AcrR family transcriptional regulator n=1 Tax=unclassified Acinetobacter TaxID=196816 RepID=UPI000A33C646|nr:MULTISPECIES: TetR/AcrR family transcriptional regulator [unclassified Acinetobacter]OTG57859.1 hypothetical protein B9T36_12880 [Acinetobacter sp. ANC 4204]